MATTDNLPKADGNTENKVEDSINEPEKTTSENNMETTETSTVENLSHKESEVNENLEKSNKQNVAISDQGEIDDVEISKDTAIQEPSRETPAQEIVKEVITEEAKENTTKDIDANEKSAEIIDQTLTPTESSDEEHHTHMNEAVAEDSEDESASAKHDIVKKDYHSMSKEDLIKELNHLVKTEKVQAIKEHVEEIKLEFNAKFNEEFEQKKEEFLEEGGNIIDFYYSTPLKKQFNSVYFDYKEKRNAYYQTLKKDLQSNLNKRLELVEELKGLLSMDEGINSTYNHFKDIQERWRGAGAIPRDKYNTVWNTYHHHVENFYDFLHLNRDFRDLDFKHNLEQKLKIIERATELAQETNVNRAFRELQLLHKMWKEDLGPVQKEYREEIWKKFSDLTKTIHDNRQQHFKEVEKDYEKNLEIKQEIISKIVNIGSDHAKTHNGWQQKIKEIEALRETFFNAGKVPLRVNEETWAKFKSAVRDFNRNKNAFYKNLKKDQYENLNKKMELVKIAEDNKDSDDFSVTTPLMKKIQADWRTIGHVPRKDSDKIWKRFKDACNHYFDRIHAERDQANKGQLESYEKKVAHLDALSKVDLTGDPKVDLETIKENISIWKTLGKVPYNKKNIENDYNKALDALFGKLNMSRKDSELIKYDNKLSAMSDQGDDGYALRNEQNFIRKKIDEVTGEIRQLENNLLFFKHAKDDNPLVKEVHNNIARHNETLDMWKAKLKKIKSL